MPKPSTWVSTRAANPRQCLVYPRLGRVTATAGYLWPSVSGQEASEPIGRRPRGPAAAVERRNAKIVGVTSATADLAGASIYTPARGAQNAFVCSLGAEARPNA
jgi:hypothetical protein